MRQKEGQDPWCHRHGDFYQGWFDVRVLVCPSQPSL